MKKIILLLISFIFIQFSYAEEKTAFFICPGSWQIVNPKEYGKYIKISFVKNQKTLIRPSINLAIEHTKLSLDEYTEAAKNNHIADLNTKFEILDKINLKQGLACICRIDKNSNSIDFDMLQMIFIKDSLAFIMTGACKKNEMIENYKSFMNIFLSFQIVDDIFSLIEDKTKKDELIQNFNDLIKSSKQLSLREKQKNISSFEKYLDKKFPNLGKYFQILLLEMAYKNIKEC
ncbi:MAG: hypothetical protein WCT85_00035 [Parachlamydiales bacterium]|jgi:hypothetical protein